MLIRALTYAAYIVVGVAVGQLAAWIVGVVAAFANITAIVAAVLGESVAVGVIFVVGTAAYAIVVGISASAGLAVLARTEGPGEAEAWAGTLGGAVAFFLTSWLAEAWVRVVIGAWPAAAVFIATSSGAIEFVMAVLLQAVPVGLLTVGAYLLLRTALRSPTSADQSHV